MPNETKVDYKQQVLRPVRQLSRRALGLVQALAQVDDTVAQRGHALARHLLADEVADQQAEKRVVL